MNRHRSWRATFVALEVLLLLTIPALTWVGFRAVLDTTEGQAVDPELDPDEPGYEASLEPTPLALVAGTDADGALSWLTVLVLSGVGDQGGAVLFVPAATLAEVEELGTTTLRDAWGTENGRNLVAQAVADVLGAGVGAPIVLDPPRVAELFAPVAPLSVRNGDELDEFPAGDLDLAPDEVAAYLVTRAADESDLTRLARHEGVWQAWFTAVAASADPDVVPGETQAGLGRFVRGIAAGESTFDVIPVTSFVPPAGEDEEPRTVAEAEALVPDAEAVVDLVEDRVPFPVAARPGSRPRVRVLDGVGADGLAVRVARDVVRAGGQVDVIGNADRFDAQTSRVVYFDEPFTAAAGEIAELVGASEVQRQQGPNPNDLVDITVVVGSDVAEAYGLTPRD